jgi:hypothetical protein
MSYLSIILSCAFLMPGLFQHNEKAVLSIMKDAEIVVAADVVKVYRPPGFLSGTVASVQHAKYKVVEVLKGKVKSKEIDVGHCVVFIWVVTGSLSAGG